MALMAKRGGLNTALETEGRGNAPSPQFNHAAANT